MKDLHNEHVAHKNTKQKGNSVKKNTITRKEQNYDTKLNFQSFYSL